MGLASPQTLLEQAPCIQTVPQDSMTSLVALGATIPAEVGEALSQTHNEMKLARKWRTEVVTRITNNVESGAADVHVVCMLESGGNGAGSWLGFPQKSCHHFTNQEYRTSVRLRIGLDVLSAGPIRCKHKSTNRENLRVCEQPLDSKGLHALLCKLGGHIDRRHNKGRDCLAALIDARVDSTVHIEQHTPDIAPDQRHPDIDFFDHEQRHVFVDIEVCTPHARTGSRSGAVRREGTLIETGEGIKRRKYRHLIIVPAVCSHFGRFGKGVQSLLRLICRETDDT